ncbi:serine/threonine protein kinase [bacterium]|nr:serine/threonine protein kinase [bacterium]
MAKQQKLGIYVIESRIGKGGMGSVYLAYDPTLKRRVAIKVLPTRLAADPDYVARFEREATTLAQIRHPNLMHIYAVGKDRGLHYIAMEYIKGHTLSGLIREKGALPLGDSVATLSQVLGALAKVHAAGIVHRDLKTTNVLVDEDGRAVLMDFGLAKPRYDHSVTTENLILGTPEYMAPELAEGADADFRSEIYAMGIILFEMLVGRVPFRSTSAIRTLREHIEKPVPSVHAIRDDLPPEIDSILARALAKTPEERYPDVQAMAAELAILGGPYPTSATLVVGATVARRTQTVATLAAEQVGSRRRPRRGYWPAVAVAALLVAAAVAVVSWPSSATDRAGGTKPGKAPGPSLDAKAPKATTAVAGAGKVAPATKRKMEPTPHKGLECVVVVRRQGSVRPHEIRGRLVKSGGEGGEMRVMTPGGTVTVPYNDIVRIEPTGGR